MQTTFDLTATIDRLNSLIDAGDFDAYHNMFDEYDEQLDEIGAFVWSVANRTGCVRIDHNGITYYLHRTPQYDEGLQLTQWDERGPVCDLNVKDADDIAVDLAYERGPIVVTTAA